MDDARLALAGQIEYLMRQSRDAYYTEYLRGLLFQLQQQTITVEYASREVMRTYQLYAQRMQAYDTRQAQQAQYVQQAQVWQAMANPGTGKKKSAEFAVGAGVLGVIGVLFILVAFVMLGITYMNGIVKGLCLYVIALVVLLFSELVLNRRMPKFAVGTTALGISGLYLATALNCLYLGNFNGWVALAISVLVALVAVLISRKKDSGIIRIISFVGCYISFFLIGWPYGIRGNLYEEDAALHFVVLAGILFIVNLMTVVLPVKKNRLLVHIFHMSANVIFTLLYACMAVFCVDAGYVMCYVVSSLLIQGLIFYSLEKEGIRSGSAADEVNVAVYVCTGVLLYIALVVCSGIRIQGEYGWLRHGAMGGLLFASILLFVLFRKSNLKWLFYWLFSFTALLIYNPLRGMANRGSFYWWSMGVTLGVFLLSKLLSRIKILRVSELVITCLTAIQACAVFVQKDWILSFSIMGAFLLSLAALHYWKALYEGIVLFVAETFIFFCFRNELTVAIMVAVLFAGVIGFNALDFFRGPWTKVLNYVCLGVMGCLYLTAIFGSNLISCCILLVLGTAFMLLAFRERFGMNFRIKNLLLAGFLCYMTMIWDIQVPFIRSIILMVIAIGAVAVGFGIREKGLRIGGLVLTLIICGKMLLFDFAGAATTDKMVLFLTVGLIVLAISGIYIALEKKIV